MDGINEARQIARVCNTVDDVLSAMVRHGAKYPGHGEQCICRDAFRQRVRQLVSTMEARQEFLLLARSIRAAVDVGSDTMCATCGHPESFDMHRNHHKFVPENEAAAALRVRTPE